MIAFVLPLSLAELPHFVYPWNSVFMGHSEPYMWMEMQGTLDRLYCVYLLYSHACSHHSLTNHKYETGWDPLLKCCNACTWTHFSSSNKIQRNYMGLKITACMRSWGKFWTQRIQRDQKKTPKPTQLPLLKSLEQKQGVGSKSRVLRMPPARNATRAASKTSQPPLWPDPQTHSYPHPI